MKELIRQSLRFGMVGVVNTIIGLLAIYGVIFFLNIGPVVANAIGYTIGLFVSFVLNRLWTFGDGRSIRAVLPRYLLVTVLSYVLNLAVVLLGTNHFSVGPYLVQFFGIGFYTVAMFIGCRRFVFRAQVHGNMFKNSH